MDESNLAPTHLKCPHCGIACNTVAASNSAERDAAGRSVPFSPAFKARKMAEAAEAARQRGKPPVSRGNRPPRPAAIGREW